MPISGYIGGGAQDALAEVLDRRLREQVRQQQEKQHADQIAIQRQQIDLQQRRDAAMDVERAGDRAWRQQQGDIATAGRLHQALGPGDIDESQASVIEKDPALAGLVRREQRPLIDARPIAGTAPLDTSGPQSRSVVELRPTAAQTKQTALEQARRDAFAKLGAATSESQRRQAGAEAGGEGIDVPNNLLGQTGAEQLAQKLADEQRANTESDRRSAREEGQIRSRPKIMTPGQAINTARGLRKEFAKEVESATKLQNTFNIMQQGMEGVRKGYTNAGAQAVLITFQKMLDEDSVVREAEYARGGEGLALMQRLQGMIQRYTVGGAGVPPEELDKFVKMSEQFLNVAKRSAQKKATLYESFATEQGLDADFVTGGMNFNEDKDTAKPPPAAGARTGRPVFDPATGTWKQQ